MLPCELGLLERFDLNGSFSFGDFLQLKLSFHSCGRLNRVRSLASFLRCDRRVASAGGAHCPRLLLLQRRRLHDDGRHREAGRHRKRECHLSVALPRATCSRLQSPGPALTLAPWSCCCQVISAAPSQGERSATTMSTSQPSTEEHALDALTSCLWRRASACTSALGSLLRLLDRPRGRWLTARRWIGARHGDTAHCVGQYTTHRPPSSIPSLG